MDVTEEAVSDLPQGTSYSEEGSEARTKKDFMKLFLLLVVLLAFYFVLLRILCACCISKIHAFFSLFWAAMDTSEFGAQHPASVTTLK